jgi:aminoglycoside phosphotransferase (APT) family kinase protein
VTLAVERDLDELRAGLERWLDRPLAADAVERPAPGWSCETLIVERSLVIRLPPLADGIFPTYDLAQQAAVQDAVGRAGVPVAGPTRLETDASFLGAAFVAMPFVDGPIPGAFTPADPWLTGLPDDGSRRSVWRSLLDTLGAIHRADPAGLALRTGLAEELAFWQGYVLWSTDGSPPPALWETLAWCRTHRPTPEPPAGLLWGDVRLGNIVFDPEGLGPRAVLDWDMASVGPAELDLGWFLALEAVQTDLTGMVVPGFGTRGEAIEVVELGLGRALVDLDWYEVFALVRASAISTRIAVLFERAGQPSMFKVGDDPTLAAAVARIDRR